MGVGSGGGSRVGEIRLELEQDGECGSGREEFGTEGSREQRSWQCFLLPPRPGPVTRAGLIPICRRLIRIHFCSRSTPVST